MQITTHRIFLKGREEGTLYSDILRQSSCLLYLQPRPAANRARDGKSCDFHTNSLSYSTSEPPISESCSPTNSCPWKSLAFPLSRLTDLTYCSLPPHLEIPSFLALCLSTVIGPCLASRLIALLMLQGAIRNLPPWLILCPVLPISSSG